jgi:hypothetical protein
MTNKNKKVWKEVFRKPVSEKQTQLKFKKFLFKEVC